MKSKFYCECHGHKELVSTNDCICSPHDGWDLAMCQRTDDICTNCKKRKASVNWVGKGSAMDFIHGDYQRWCLHCATKVQLANAKKQARKIPILERRLARLT